MTSPSDPLSELDRVLAEFFGELDKASKPEEVLRRFCDVYPQYANEFRDDLRIRPALGDRDSHRREECPQRLGDFHIVRRIDSGGMGDIYEAIQEPLKRRVVVKTIRREVISPHARELTASRSCGRFPSVRRAIGGLRSL